MTDNNSVDNLKLLLQGLLWPAAAGNVFWVFFQTCLDGEDWSSEAKLAKLTTVFLLASYLALAWLRSFNFVKIGKGYFLADICLISTIVVFAIEIHSSQSLADPSKLEYYLAAVFICAFFFNLVGAWEMKQVTDYDTESLTRIHFLGYIIILLSNLLFAESYPLNLALSLLIVVALWCHLNDTH